ncbi:MAG: glycogen debranching enzyme GlgX, partial [Acidobacteria bacterium]|nr:glycogen debranching enzyme GlgX [Acidobacteriota bacterium]
MAELQVSPAVGAAHSRAFPLGLSAPPQGDPMDTVNVAVYAPALADVVVYVQEPGQEWRGVLLPDFDDGVHHGVVTNMPVGSLYGFRSAGPDMSGHVDFDPASEQLLLDPYGRHIHTETIAAAGRELYFSVRMHSGFDWGQDAHPHTSWRDTVIYEAHVKGQTMLHPDVPENIRGTYAGLAHVASIEHLKRLGITAVQLLPIHFHLDEPHLTPKGLTNYWGYNTLGFFAPQVSYASADARAAGPQAVQDELKGMIKLLHAAGVEVILDVVYNHTAEGAATEPALSWRGLANYAYYRHHGEHYADTTGCGNSLDFSNPRVIQQTLDSLRYWVEEFHVDGFRFDLAVTLGRNAANEFRTQHPFLIAAATDRVLSGTKLIAEPWDLGPDGWQTGRFPVGWVDWNDHFRDSARDFWLTDRAAIDAGREGGSVRQISDSLAGSAQLFAGSHRSQLASINMITAHDGFTLADLVAYNSKHNEANGEDNRDGGDHNHSWNHGVEGRAQDPAILAARAQSARNLMATLLLSMGVPMITAGDELGRSQRGNNNAYCQDNELTWLDWSLDESAQN